MRILVSVVPAFGQPLPVAALMHGLPMVLWPQGAEQPIIAERTRATGASVTVAAAAEIAPALETVLGDSPARAAARIVRDQVRATADADDVLSTIAADLAAA